MTEYSYNNKTKSLRVKTENKVTHYKGERAVELYKKAME